MGSYIFTAQSSPRVSTKSDTSFQVSIGESKWVQILYVSELGLVTFIAINGWSGPKL